MIPKQNSVSWPAAKKHFDKTFSKIIIMLSDCFNEHIYTDKSQNITALTYNLQDYCIDSHGVRQAVPL